MKQSTYIFGGGLLVAGIGIAYYLHTKSMASGVSTQQAAIDATGAIPNTPGFGAMFEGASNTGSYAELGAPVADYGPGPSSILPPPQTPPAPISWPVRKSCACCLDSMYTSLSQINQNSAALIQAMYNEAQIGSLYGSN